MLFSLRISNVPLSVSICTHPSHKLQSMPWLHSGCVVVVDVVELVVVVDEVVVDVVVVVVVEVEVVVVVGVLLLYVYLNVLWFMFWFMLSQVFSV